MTKEETLYESLCKCDPRARLEYPTLKEFLECDEDFKRILNAMLEAMESYATDRLDSYKESLRLAIEEQRSGFPSKNHFLFTAKEVLDLIDQVTPKE